MYVIGEPVNHTTAICVQEKDWTKDHSCNCALLFLGRRNYVKLLNLDVAYFIILFCLMPDNCIHQGESAATQWVKIILMREHQSRRLEENCIG